MAVLTNEMLNFIEIDPIANMRAYGLGTQVYDLNFTYGKKAIGHGGGNIGTTTYMLYFPDYHMSIVVMINAFPNKGIEVITKGLIRLVIKDISTLDVLIYSDFYRFRYIAIGSIVFMIIIITYHLRKKRKLVRHN